MEAYDVVIIGATTEQLLPKEAPNNGSYAWHWREVGNRARSYLPASSVSRIAKPT
ncbi:MAG: hypothetical protein IGS39_13125 [Calothrix sp. C42_A2020_038]|nr:hypothetical protein [Calothrix sp. C42_A2020_038]